MSAWSRNGISPFEPSTRTAGGGPGSVLKKAAAKEGLGHLRELAEKLQNEASLIAISDQQNGT